MMRVVLAIIILCANSQSIFALPEVMKIGLFSDNRPSNIIVSPNYGDYEVFADGKKVYELTPGKAIQLIVQGNSVFIKNTEEDIGLFKSAEIKRKAWGNSFKIKSIFPSRVERSYFDNLHVNVMGGKLRVVNHVYIEHYIGGVVESEAGSKQILEYYKVQSIICRTYALSNIRRHSKEGFHLCDQVHCQVYKSKSRFNTDIRKAVNATKGIVIVDSNIKLITAAFHSNCGGHTANSEDVWKYPVSYLRAVTDTFCHSQPHATWEREIPKDNWLKYLRSKFNYPVEDTLHLLCALDYCPVGREDFLTPLDTNILLKNIRKDWDLRSAIFSIEEMEDTIRLEGSGFGHGVGVCQEGAMRMANHGIPFNEILHYYYTDVHLVGLSVLDFFKEF